MVGQEEKARTTQDSLDAEVAMISGLGESTFLMFTVQAHFQ